MKAWLKGGLIGFLILSIFFMVFWINASIHNNCLLHPAQLLNVGGAICGWYIGSVADVIMALLWILVPFAILFFIGFIVGVPMGWIIGKLKKKKVAK